jgi:hypothetical protein
MMTSNAVPLATTGISVGAVSRAMTVGAAGVAYSVNPMVVASVEEHRKSVFFVDKFSNEDMRRSGFETLRFDFALRDGVSLHAPGTLDEFVRLYASPDGGAITDYIGPASPFEALAAVWDEKELRSQKMRMTHAWWVYRNLALIREDSRKVLAEFERTNPGRESGAILDRLSRATHEAWLSGEMRSPSFVPYTQGLHDLLTAAMESGSLETPTLAVHRNPRKKFRVKPSDLRFPDEETGRAFAAHFQKVTGLALAGGLVINTVGGSWDDLAGIVEPATPEWSSLRRAFLIGLQLDNVGAVLRCLEKPELLSSLSEGITADRLQSLIEMLRIVNVSWRINNPWGGPNSPLIQKPFALEEDGGIGIDDILKDAVTMNAVLRELNAGLAAGTVSLPEEVAAGLRGAFAHGLTDVLEVMVDKEALTVAVRHNTDVYREAERQRAALEASADAEPL